LTDPPVRQTDKWAIAYMLSRAN